MTEYTYNLYLVKESGKKNPQRRLAIAGEKHFTAEYGAFRPQDILGLLVSNPRRYGYEMNYQKGLARLGSVLIHFDPKHEEVFVEAVLVSMSMVEAAPIVP